MFGAEPHLRTATADRFIDEIMGQHKQPIGTNTHMLPTGQIDGARDVIEHHIPCGFGCLRCREEVGDTLSEPLQRASHHRVDDAVCWHETGILCQNSWTQHPDVFLNLRPLDRQRREHKAGRDADEN